MKLFLAADAEGVFGDRFGGFGGVIAVEENDVGVGCEFGGGNYEVGRLAVWRGENRVAVGGFDGD